MKKIFTTLALALFVSIAQAQYSKILSMIQFDNLENKVLDDFGTKANPIKSGAFMHLENPRQ